jgi:hypothetical protein
MQKRVRLWSIWLQVAILLTFVAATAFIIIDVRSKPAGKSDLKIVVSQLRSHAAESQLLVDQAAAQHLTSTYLISHTHKLQEMAQSLSKQLNSIKVDASLDVTRTRVTELATALNNFLGNVPQSSDGHSDATAMKQSFADLVSQLIEVENSLKE